MSNWDASKLDIMQLIEAEESIKTLIPFSTNNEVVELRYRLSKIKDELNTRRRENQKLIVEMIG